jgi:hypothetical protein
MTRIDQINIGITTHNIELQTYRLDHNTGSPKQRRRRQGNAQKAGEIKTMNGNRI